MAEGDTGGFGVIVQCPGFYLGVETLREPVNKTSVIVNLAKTGHALEDYSIKGDRGLFVALNQGEDRGVCVENISIVGVCL